MTPRRDVCTATSQARVPRRREPTPCLRPDQRQAIL